MDNWGTIEQLSINLEKTDVVTLTRMRKTEGDVRLEYQGVKLNLSTDVKYLGVIPDDD